MVIMMFSWGLYSPGARIRAAVRNVQVQMVRVQRKLCNLARLQVATRISCKGSCGSISERGTNCHIHGDRRTTEPAEATVHNNDQRR